MLYDYGGDGALADYGTTDYPIAATPKYDRSSYKVKTIMLFDIRAGTLLGEIPLPESNRKTRPNFALDVKNHVLVASGDSAQWLMAIDLRPYIDRTYPKEDFGDGKKYMLPAFHP